MTDRFFLDTNLLVYLFDKSEKTKQKKVKDLLLENNNNPLFISAQIINEFINITTRKIEFPISFDKLDEVIYFLKARFTIFPISIETSVKAIELKQQYRLSFWDCLVISSALENNCTILYSEDMHHGQIIDDSLKIINPFKF